MLVTTCTNQDLEGLFAALRVFEVAGPGYIANGPVPERFAKLLTNGRGCTFALFGHQSFIRVAQIHQPVDLECAPSMSTAIN